MCFPLFIDYLGFFIFDLPKYLSKYKHCLTLETIRAFFILFKVVLKLCEDVLKLRVSTAMPFQRPKIILEFL